MERNIITMNESGNIIVPENVTDIWMSEPELVELFGIIVPPLRVAICAVYKSGVLKEYEVQRYVRLENGYYADVCTTIRDSVLTNSERELYLCRQKESWVITSLCPMSIQRHGRVTRINARQTAISH